MRFYLIFSLLLSVTAYAKDNWPVFYNAEKGPEHLSISREAFSLSAYTNDFPSWNYDLLTPRAKISSADIKELGKVNDLRVVEARLSITDIYYTDTLMILEEVKPDQFLPIYVQVYNREIRKPSDCVVTNGKKKLIIQTGVDYDGTTHFHDHYKITLSPKHDPVVVGPDY